MLEIDIRSLPENSHLTVETRNSFYDIIVRDKQNIEIFGGFMENDEIRFKNQKAYLVGCTFGGSCVKVRYLTVGMRMEIAYNKEFITTSPIKKITLSQSATL